MGGKASLNQMTLKYNFHLKGFVYIFTFQNTFMFRKKKHFLWNGNTKESLSKAGIKIRKIYVYKWFKLTGSIFQTLAHTQHYKLIWLTPATLFESNFKLGRQRHIHNITLVYYPCVQAPLSILLHCCTKVRL